MDKAIATLKTIIEQDGLLGRAVNIAIVQNNLMIAQLMKKGYIADAALDFDLSDLVDMLIQGVVPNPKMISSTIDAAWAKLYAHAIENKIGVSPYAVRRMPENYQIKFPVNPNNPFKGYEDVHESALEFSAAEEIKMASKANGLKWMWADVSSWSDMAQEIYNAYARDIAKHMRESTQNDKNTMARAVKSAQTKFLEYAHTREESNALMLAMFQHVYSKREEDRAAPDGLLFQPSVIDGEMGFLDWFLQMWEEGKSKKDWAVAPVLVKTKNMWFSVWAAASKQANPKYADCPPQAQAQFKKAVEGIDWLGKQVTVDVEHLAKYNRTWLIGTTGTKLSMSATPAMPGKYTVVDSRPTSDGEWVLFLQGEDMPEEVWVNEADDYDAISEEAYNEIW